MQRECTLVEEADGGGPIQCIVIPLFRYPFPQGNAVQHAGKVDSWPSSFQGDDTSTPYSVVIVCFLLSFHLIVQVVQEVVTVHTRTRMGHNASSQKPTQTRAEGPKIAGDDDNGGG